MVFVRSCCVLILGVCLVQIGKVNLKKKLFTVLSCGVLVVFWSNALHVLSDILKIWHVIVFKLT